MKGLKSPSQLTFLIKSNATMNNHDSQSCINEDSNFDSYFSLLKPLLGAFKFINILKNIQLMKVLIHIWLR